MLNLDVCNEFRFSYCFGITTLCNLENQDRGLHIHCNQSTIRCCLKKTAQGTITGAKTTMFCFTFLYWQTENKKYSFSLT